MPFTRSIAMFIFALSCPSSSTLLPTISYSNKICADHKMHIRTNLSLIDLFRDLISAMLSVVSMCRANPLDDLCNLRRQRQDTALVKKNDGYIEGE